MLTNHAVWQQVFSNIDKRVYLQISHQLDNSIYDLLFTQSVSVNIDQVLVQVYDRVWIKLRNTHAH